MAWVRFDDKRALNAKLRAAGFEARGLDEAAICWSAHQEADGFISDDDLDMLAAMHKCRRVKALAARLVDVGRWYRDDARRGYVIHDFLEFNPSKTELAARREWDRRRKDLYADKDLVDAVKRRDGDRCRYCGVHVNWRDRRGPNGAQLDHVTPRGEATIENIVVACRGCNIRKGGRTPTQAGMVLLPVGSMGCDEFGTRSELDTDQNVFTPRPVPSRPVPSPSLAVVPSSNSDAGGGLG